ncbi:uncharacterized protein LOC115227766 [Octopus sinensis]|uniref:Uncharacterized protein LOC115227766 n=1 Tax=Octopus sinensis TaxID=2607531 RepID=A0A7E6EH36_9MOLL|nr:uncharacterized protein LOC115227766 [Octopus sinensis]
MASPTGHAVDPADGCTKVGKTWMDVDYYQLKSINNKRKRLRNDDAGDIEGFMGPWAPFEGEEAVSRPNQDQLKELNEIVAKRNAKKGNAPLETNYDVKSVLHGRILCYCSDGDGGLHGQVFYQHSHRRGNQSPDGLCPDQVLYSQETDSHLEWTHQADHDYEMVPQFCPPSPFMWNGRSCEGRLCVVFRFGKSMGRGGVFRVTTDTIMR